MCVMPRACSLGSSFDTWNGPSSSPGMISWQSRRISYLSLLVSLHTDMGFGRETRTSILLQSCPAPVRISIGSGSRHRAGTQWSSATFWYVWTHLNELAYPLRVNNLFSQSHRKGNPGAEGGRNGPGVGLGVGQETRGRDATRSESEAPGSSHTPIAVNPHRLQCLQPTSAARTEWM